MTFFLIAFLSFFSFSIQGWAFDHSLLISSVTKLYHQDVMPLARKYCGYSKAEQKAYVNMLKNKFKVLPYEKKPPNYKKEEVRMDKTDKENTKIYDPKRYPHAQVSYELGLIYGYVPCEAFAPDQALYYFSKAAKNPSAVTMASGVYYKQYSLTQQEKYLQKAYRLFKKM